MSDKQRTIRRAQHGKENPYFLMRRATAQDDSLSWEARGMLCYLLSKPDDWEVRVSDLEQQCSSGRVYRILNELAAAGYVQKPKKSRGDGGLWTWTPYLVYEVPIISAASNDSSQDASEPDTGFPDTDEPDTEKGEIKQSTDLHNIDTQIANTTDFTNTPLPDANVMPGELLYHFAGRTPTPYQLDLVDKWIQAHGEEQVLSEMRKRIESKNTDMAQLDKHFCSDHKQEATETDDEMLTAFVEANGISKPRADEVPVLDSLRERGVKPKEVADFIEETLAQHWYSAPKVTAEFVAKNIDEWLPDYRHAQSVKNWTPRIVTDEEIAAWEANYQKELEERERKMLERLGAPA